MRPEGRKARGDRHYPPDALGVTGHSRSRKVITSPTYLALAEELGQGYRHVVYRAVHDMTEGNCYDPRLLRGIRGALREILRITAKRGHMAMVGVETGEGRRPLHMHVLCGPDAPLPPGLVVKHEGEVMAQFALQAPEPQNPAKPLTEAVQYLLKSGHAGGKAFCPGLASGDSSQPPAFRAALQALEEGRRLARDLGLTRLPPRTFVLWGRRLTAAQRDAAVQHIGSALARLTTPRAISSITPAEWERVRDHFPHGARTREALEKVRQGLNVILHAEAEGICLKDARRKKRQVPALSTIYEYREKFGAVLQKARGLVAALRGEGSALKKLLARLLPRKKFPESQEE